MSSDEGRLTSAKKIRMKKTKYSCLVILICCVCCVCARADELSLQTEPLPFFKQTAQGWRRGVNVSINNPGDAVLPAELIWNSKDLSASQKLDLRPGANETMLLAPDVDRIELTLQTANGEITNQVTLPPSRKWHIYIVPTTHTDIGFTDLQERVRVRHADNGLLTLEWLGQFPDFEWYFETYWQLNALLTLHPEKTDEVFGRLRQKRMGLSASYANTLTGLCSSEALNRLTLDSRNLANRGGFELNSFVMDDVPSAIGSVPMMLSDSGIKYFIEGANIHHAVYAGSGPNPFYWEGADGGRVLADITTLPAYGGAKHLLPNMSTAVQLLPPWLARFENTNYPYDAVLMNGAYSDNNRVQPWLLQMIPSWNQQWDYHKLTLALPEDFYGYLETHYSNDIPVLKTDFGGWWEVGAASSALETGLSRRNEERAVTAEMLHSLAGIMTGSAYPKTNFDEVWHNVLLYNEHTWGSSVSVKSPNAEPAVKEWQVKSGYAHDGDTESRALLASGMSKLAAMVPAADCVVFNSLAWPRDALVVTKATGAMQDIETGKIFPSQPLPEGGSCFIANDLPAVGYRCYRQSEPSEAKSGHPAVHISGNRMENEFYRVTLNPKTGGIQSIYDKQLRRELVDSHSQYDLGELVYAMVNHGAITVHADHTNSPPALELHRQVGTEIKSSNGPVFGELTSEATNENFPNITLRVRLYRGLKQLDLVYELDKTETTSNEAVYLAFPFAFDANKGGLWFEYPDEITEPLKDQDPSACRDWYSVQRWLAVSDGKDTVELSPLDAPLFTFGGITPDTWQHKLSFNRGHVFAYLMNNYWEDNYKAAQGGKFTFRYSLTSSAGGFSRRDAVVSGWNMFCPPAAAPATAPGAGHQPVFTAPARSLVEIQPPGLPLTAIKEAEDENGFVFRCWDFSGAGGTATLRLPRPASDVFSCNLVETDARKLNDRGRTVTTPIKPFGPVTLKMRFNGD